MPQNRVIYWGIVALVGTVLLWIGGELTKRIGWILPYTAAAAVAMIVSGFIYELWKRRAKPQAEAEPATDASASSQASQGHP